MVKKLLIFVQDEVVSKDRLLSLVVILTFLWGAMTQLMNLEAILGAFIMGILFGTMPRLPEDVIHTLESMALGVFGHIFFAVAGLQVKIMNMYTTTHIVINMVVFVV